MPYVPGAAARRSQQPPLAQQLHHESNPLGVRAENPFLQPEQRQPSPFSMTTSDGSSTTTTSANDEGYFPSFEIGQDEVVTEVAPRAQQQHQLSASVADAWVQMADEEARDTRISNTQLSFPPQQTTNVAVASTTKPSTTLQAQEPNNNIFRRTSRTVVDWWQAPCQAPSQALPETAALHWPRRSRRGLGGNTDVLSHGGLIPPNPSGGRHRAQRGNDHDREDRCLHPSYQQPATAAGARRSHQAARAAVPSCHNERRQDASVTTTHGSCSNKTSHNSGSWKTDPKPNNSTTTTTQFLPARLRVSLADSPSDRTAPSGGAAAARPTSSSSSWRNHPAARSSLNHSNNKASKPAKSSSSHKSKPPNSKSTKNNTHSNSSSNNKNTTMTDSNQKASSSLWKTAVDPKSGKTYYYHTETRETQWRKPLELASDSERQAMREKEARQRDFFAAMEANILKNLQAGAPSLEKKKSSRRTMSKAEHNLAEDNNDEEQNSDLDSSDDEYEDRAGSATGPDRPGLLVRTISSFDERILKDLVMRVPSHRRLSSERSLATADSSPTDVAAELEESDSKKPSLQDLRGTSEGSLEDMELLGSDSNDSGSNANRPGALRGSTRQPSLGTVLATLPEEHEPSMENLEFSFGEQSFADMGLSEQESQALMNFAQVSSEMALMGDESFILHEDDDEDAAEPLNGLAEGSDEDRSEEDVSNDPLELEDDEEDDDPLKNMSMQPTPMASGNKTMARGVASQRVLPSSSGIARPKVSRRNTCGTLYVGSTMSAPDVDATIKCVCGVIRAHIVQSEMDPSYRHEFLVFNDQESQQRRPSMVNEKAPSLDQICAFYRDVFRRAQMESDCIIMSLIYVERLIKSTHGKLRPRASNWRSVLFSSMVLASKVWDDLSMWNGDFSQTCPAGVKFTLQRINQLELAVLDALSYKVKVPASEYAKYYFLLRAMLIKSGLGGDAMKELNPLDVDGARRLQAVSSKYQRAASLRMIGNTTGPRSKSLTIEMEGGGGGKNSLKNSLSNMDFDNDEEDRGDPTLSPRGKVSLEHMVQM